MSLNTNPEIIEQVLTRGVAEVLPKKDKLAALMQQKKIRLYLGIDPTGNFLTLGHGVVLRKLQQFADLGHDVILLIGNGTVKIGDPTGRDSTRPVLTDEMIMENFKHWKEQASKILDFEKIRILKNGDWLDSMSFPDIIRLLGKVTVQQLMERDMFQERLKKGQPIHGHEILYPMLQGYDSVEMEVDLEIGGTDQTFNMLMGRTLLRQIKEKEKSVLSVPIINGTDGRKMSKSYGNFIALNEEPKEMFGKLMSIKDEEMEMYFEIFTDIDMTKAKTLIKDSPRDAKILLAKTIVTWLHDKTAAEQGFKDFENKFVKQGTPDEMPEFKVSEPTSILTILTDITSFAVSGSEARRFIQQGGVSVDGEKIIEVKAEMEGSSDGKVLKVGKRKWGRLTN